VKVRAKIEQRSKYLLAITELPYGVTTETLIESILAANAKGKIKIKHVDDNTADKVEILVHLPQGAEPDKVIQQLYVFTNCQVQLSPPPASSSATPTPATTNRSLPRRPRHPQAQRRGHQANS
jgi:topoisomerase-4 subunit A